MHPEFSCCVQEEEDPLGFGPSSSKIRDMEASAGMRGAAAFPQTRVLLNDDDVPLLVRTASGKSGKRRADSMCPYLQESPLIERVSQLESSVVKAARFDCSKDTLDRVGGSIGRGWLSSDVSCDLP